MKSSITFKAFIQEEEVEGKPLVYKQLSLDEAVKHLQTDFSKCAWMVKENRPFYRGERNYVTDAYAWVDSSKSKRKSQNTSNYYTLILDNHPGRKNFPKRSASLICSTSEKIARGYDNTPVRIIPGNTAKIGFVNKSDMWHTKINLFGISNDVEHFNSYWDRLSVVRDDNWNSWKKLDALLKLGDEDDVKRFYNVFLDADADDHLHFLEKVFDAYSAQKTGHTAYTASTLSDENMYNASEAWVGGPCLIVHQNHWTELKKALGE